MALEFCLSHNYFWFAGRFCTQKRGVAMGAKFSPSLANLFMSEWEDRHIYGQQRSELLFYKRFIDDPFILGFLTNNNIKLDCHWSREHNYLDVTVMLCNKQLITKIYFKPTDRNSYLPIYSGHHPAWLRNIPKGQFTRIRRNGTRDADFVTLS